MTAACDCTYYVLYVAAEMIFVVFHFFSLLFAQSCVFTNDGFPCQAVRLGGVGKHLVEAGLVSSRNQTNHWEIRIADRDVRNGEEFVVLLFFGLGNISDEHTSWCSSLNCLARLRGCPSRS